MEYAPYKDSIYERLETIESKLDRILATLCPKPQAQARPVQTPQPVVRPPSALPSKVYENMRKLGISEEAIRFKMNAESFTLPRNVQQDIENHRKKIRREKFPPSHA